MMRETVRNMALLKRTYDAIADLWAERQFAPSFRDVARKAGYCASSTAYEHCRALQALGYIEYSAKTAHSLRIVKPWPESEAA